MLIDSHCHLNFPELKENLPEIVKRARAEGVSLMQTICTNISDLPEILEITDSYPNIYASVGVHPNEVQDVITADELICHAQHKKIIGIGETGLDFYYEKSDRNKQIESFIAHIEAARATSLPLIVHTRNADFETIDILTKEMKKASFKGLIHCFSTSREVAIKSIELGLYISISGIITFKKSIELQDIVKDLPLSSLLIETDAPFLAPMPMRGKPNEPSYVKHTALFLAELQNISFEEVAKATTANFLQLFSKKIDIIS